MVDCIDCITKSMERKKAREKIICPFCGHEKSNDDYQYPVTYWAEDGSQEMECNECGKTFWIREHVERYYDVGKRLDDMGYPTNKEENNA